MEREIVQKKFLINKNDPTLNVHFTKIMKELKVLDHERITEQSKITGNTVDPNNLIQRIVDRGDDFYRQ